MATLTMRDTRFWNRIADKYSRRPVPDQNVYEEKLARTQAYFEPHHEVFEFGCGTGTTALIHAPHVARIEATDLSPRMIEIARDKAKAMELDTVTFRAAPFPEGGESGQFNVVLGLNILHLLPDLDTALEAAAHALKPGGVFVSSTPCLGDFVPFFRWIGPLGRALGLLPMLNVFTQSQLLAAFDQAGFEIVERWMPGKRAGLFLVARKRG